MRRRLRGLRHMIQTKNKILIKCHPSNVTWDDYVKDCNLTINTVDIMLMNIQRKKRNWLGRRGLTRKGQKISIVRIQLSRFVINHGDLLGYVIMYVKLLKNKTDIYILSDKESVIPCRRNRY